MLNFKDTVSQIRSTPMSRNPLADVTEMASMLAKAIVRQEKEQRAEPYVKALEELSGKYATADAASRPGINQQANIARADYLAKGGSPLDLPTERWGADPSKGFQTGASQFVPGYLGDNLSFGQKRAMAPLTGMFEGKPTWDRIVQTAGLTGLFEGKPTWTREAQTAGMTGMLQGKPTMDKINSDRGYGLQLNDNSRAWAGLDQQKSAQNLSTLFNIWEATGKAPAGIPGVAEGTPLSSGQAGVDPVMQTAISMAQKDPNFEFAETPEERQQIINNYYDLLGGGQSGITDEDILSMTGK